MIMFHTIYILIILGLATLKNFRIEVLRADEFIGENA